MFTPDFGMFIAPGCNGIRGSVTMGLIALIAGYVYRFRWYANILVVIGAVLLGYLFNLVRLCLLVLYYMVALHFPTLQNKAENADYVIGAALFLTATLLLFAVVHRLRDARNPNFVEPTPIAEQGGFEASVPGGQYARLVAMGLLVLLGCSELAHAVAESRPLSSAIADATSDRFPARLGSYTLARTWNETMSTGQVVYLWAQYSPSDGSVPIAVGVSPILGWHDPLICHSIRGDDPLWRGQLSVMTAGAVPVNFSSAFYDDGVTQHIEASTQCSGASCGEYATQRTHFGFVYSRPAPRSLLSANPRRPVPVLIRAETLGNAMPADANRQQLTQDLRAFLASVRLDDLTQPYSR
jgi:exosortase J